MNPAFGERPRLGPDFAARVLQRVDILIARRRRTKQISVGTAAALALALAIVATTQFGAPGNSSSRAESAGTLDSRANWADVGSSDVTADSTLAYLVPDAAPVDRFVEQYSAANYGFTVIGATVAESDIDAVYVPRQDRNDWQ
jgi:hypothetical protein